MNIGDARSVTDEAAGLDKLVPLENRRDGTACGQTYDLVAPAVEERISGDDEGVRAPLDKCGKKRTSRGEDSPSRYEALLPCASA